MKTTAAVLALLVGAFSATPFLTRPVSPAVTRAPRTHTCCCTSCPGPGLCPCDSSGKSACVKASDDIPSHVETPLTPSPLKMACDLPHSPRRLDSGRWDASPDFAPPAPLSIDPLEKVPISLA